MNESKNIPNDNKEQQHHQSSANKRQRRGRSLVPMVFAPRKVLQVLYALWPEKSHEKYFRGVAREDRPEKRNALWNEWNNQFTCPPVLFWENVAVDHCRKSFGCVFRLRRR
jgi:hypothetical protein